MLIIMIKKIKSKIKSRKGETLVETLVALLITVLAMTMLAVAIVSAAKVNKGADEINTGFSTFATKSDGSKVSTEKELTNFTIKIKNNSTSSESTVKNGTVKAYQVGTLDDDDKVNYDDAYVYYNYSVD